MVYYEYFWWCHWGVFDPRHCLSLFNFLHKSTFQSYFLTRAIHLCNWPICYSYEFYGDNVSNLYEMELWCFDWLLFEDQKNKEYCLLNVGVMFNPGKLFYLYVWHRTPPSITTCFINKDCSEFMACWSICVMHIVWCSIEQSCVIAFFLSGFDTMADYCCIYVFY